METFYGNTYVEWTCCNVPGNLIVLKEGKQDADLETSKQLNKQDTKSSWFWQKKGIMAQWMEFGEKMLQGWFGRNAF